MPVPKWLREAIGVGLPSGFEGSPFRLALLFLGIAVIARAMPRELWGAFLFVAVLLALRGVGRALRQRKDGAKAARSRKGEISLFLTRNRAARRDGQR